MVVGYLAGVFTNAYDNNTCNLVVHGWYSFVRNIAFFFYTK